jgi:hypothetical protein
MPPSKAALSRSFDIDQVDQLEPHPRRFNGFAKESRTGEKSVAVSTILLSVLFIFLGLTAVSEF